MIINRLEDYNKFIQLINFYNLSSFKFNINSNNIVFNIPITFSLHELPSNITTLLINEQINPHILTIPKSINTLEINSKLIKSNKYNNYLPSSIISLNISTYSLNYLPYSINRLSVNELYHTNKMDNITANINKLPPSVKHIVLTTPIFGKFINLPPNLTRLCIIFSYNNNNDFNILKLQLHILNLLPITLKTIQIQASHVGFNHDIILQK